MSKLITTYRGKDVIKMSKQELIEAVIDLGTLYTQATEKHLQDLEKLEALL